MRYATRDRELGLLATLAGAVEAASTDAADIARSWRQIEVRCRRPLVVVVDQIEEAYTADRPEGERDEPNATNLEMRAFVAAVAKLFATSDERPVGRLVLGFRKEWLSDVEGLLEASMVGRTEVRLDQLTRDGVIEAIAKPALLPRDRVRTALTIEPGLDVEIADDLLANRAAHVAPLLQIILADMWSVAPCDAEGVVHFDADLYHRVRAQAKELDGFIGARLAEIERRMPLVGTSGLALDYLEWYTTSKGTAAAHPGREERETYSGNAGGTEVTGFAASRVDGLRRLCIELSLLVESDEDLVGVAAEDRFARLAHDTLAPLIRERAAQPGAPRSARAASAGREARRFRHGARAGRQRETVEELRQRRVERRRLACGQGRSGRDPDVNAVGKALDRAKRRRAPTAAARTPWSDRDPHSAARRGDLFRHPQSHQCGERRLRGSRRVGRESAGLHAGYEFAHERLRARARRKRRRPLRRSGTLSMRRATFSCCCRLRGPESFWAFTSDSTIAGESEMRSATGVEHSAAVHRRGTGLGLLARILWVADRGPSGRRRVISP